MSLADLIKAAENVRSEQIKAAKNNPTDNPQKKTRFDSRQFER